MMWLPLTATRNWKSDNKGNKETLKKVRKQRNPSQKTPYSSLPNRSSFALISANLSSRSLSSHSKASLASLSSSPAFSFDMGAVQQRCLACKPHNHLHFKDK